MATVAPIRANQQPENLRSEPFTPAESWELFDKTARLYVGISGQDFLSRWDEGYFRDPDSEPRVMRVVSLIPLVRKISARQKPR